MADKNLISRRSALKAVGAIGAFALMGTKTIKAGERKTVKRNANLDSSEVRKKIFQKVSQTPLIDTHEHLLEEAERLQGSKHPFVRCDDWSLLFSHYTENDLLTAGMPQEAFNKFFSDKTDPIEKWSIVEPYWPAVKNTGYGQASAITIKELYGIEQLSGKTIGKVQAGYEKLRRPGFYKHILRDLANIESCQVNYIAGRPFSESPMPTLLMQDLSILGMIEGPDIDQYGKPAGIEVKSLANWHEVIDFWFEKYGKYAVAVKSQQAYYRDIDYEKVPAEKAQSIFKKKLSGKELNAKEKKTLEDHLFWYAVDKATENKLPVKLHTGYYAGQNYMPLSRLKNNPASATDLCRAAPQTNFVFMHIAYPYYEEMISVAKHYTNAYIDMCWAWIINPIAAKDFLKKYLVTAPANKVLTFGGDYIPVENVLGHAVIARRGIALALAELVEEGWISLDNALELTDPIMHGNARGIFRLKEKTKLLEKVK